MFPWLLVARRALMVAQYSPLGMCLFGEVVDPGVVDSQKTVNHMNAPAVAIQTAAAAVVEGPEVADIADTAVDVEVAVVMDADCCRSLLPMGWYWAVLLPDSLVGSNPLGPTW